MIFSGRKKRNSKQRTANINELEAMMSFSLGDITQESPQKRGKKRAKRSKVSTASKVGSKKGTKVASKYEITTEETTHRWTGRVLIPLVLKALSTKVILWITA